MRLKWIDTVEKKTIIFIEDVRRVFVRSFHCGSSRNGAWVQKPVRLAFPK